VVVGAAFSVLFMAYGAQFSFGVFFSALLEEFGWSRAALSGAFSLYAFGYSGLAVVSGWLTDRLGPRAVVATGGIFSARAGSP
jgi:OFA family oxalate/formate antiporter-like MFS transporter